MNSYPGFKYSVWYKNLHLTVPFSPFVSSSLSIQSIFMHCLITPQCYTAWYPHCIVVAWCKTMISASNSFIGFGFSFGSNRHIPFLKSLREIGWLLLSDLMFSVADWGLDTEFSDCLKTWIDLTTTGLYKEKLSGPSYRFCPMWTVPWVTIPLTQSPTPFTVNFSWISNSTGSSIFPRLGF